MWWHTRRNQICFSAKRTSQFNSAGASVQSTAGSRVVRINDSNAGYTMFRGSVKGTGYPLHSPVYPSLPLPCVTVFHRTSTGVYQQISPSNWEKFSPSQFGERLVDHCWRKTNWALCSICALQQRQNCKAGKVGVDSSWNVMAHGDAQEGKWRGSYRMQWVASTLHTTSEHGVSSITTADAHSSAASSRLNWRPPPRPI